MLAMVRGMAVHIYQRLVVNPSMELYPASMRERVSDKYAQPHLLLLLEAVIYGPKVNLFIDSHIR
jgi:hypothetical protein